MHTWDPTTYLSYADERTRPFVELLARVPDPNGRAVASVVDLGCGPGHLAGLLARRWPGARLPDPLDLLPAMVGRVAPGGFLAIGVPANFDAPSHVLRRELAAEEPYAAHTAGVASPWSPGAMAYLEALSDLGCEVDAWETTYLHVLEGEDAVFEWISGAGARPTLQALPAGLREEFADELRRRLRAAYPPRDGRVVLPFRRAFAVARVPA